MGKRDISIKTGIEIWDGLPGSGKSYSSVQELINTIIKERRPVYTNLPLKPRVLRKLLVVRSLNPSTANYIQHLTRDHFDNFVKRNQIYTEFSESAKGQGYSQGYIDRVFDEMHGPGKVKGENADWIPIGSVLILDEFHRWADQRMQRAEDPAYLLYATMHRHHMHRIIIATQDKMQVSITWRRNAETWVHHSDKRKLPFLFGITLPIPAFARETWPKEYMEESRVGQKPTKTEVFIPWLTGGLTWRLYDSFTHMGGARRLGRAIEKTRQQIEGDQYEKLSTGDEEMSVQTTVKSRLWGMCKTLILIAAMVWMGGKIMRLGQQNEALVTRQAEEQKRYDEQMKLLREQVTLLSTTTAITGRRQGYNTGNPPSVTTIGNGYCIANGQLIKPGQTVMGFELRELDNETSKTIWVYQGMDFIVPLMRHGMQPPDQQTNDAASARTNRHDAGKVSTSLGQIQR